HDVHANVSAPKRVRLVTGRAVFWMLLADENGKFQLSSGSTRITLQEPFNVGIGVCSHDTNVVEKAVFSNVSVDARPEAPRASSDSAAANTSAPTTLYSTLEVISVDAA